MTPITESPKHCYITPDQSHFYDFGCRCDDCKSLIHQWQKIKLNEADSFGEDSPKLILEAIALNFEMRAHNLETHMRRSHSANTQHRKNAEIMMQAWKDAALYVRERMKEI